MLRNVAKPRVDFDFTVCTITERQSQLLLYETGIAWEKHDMPKLCAVIPSETQVETIKYQGEVHEDKRPMTGRLL
ncbi:hypothetical protein QLX08_000952 [Tetragonisca angustula]|uniref:Uncharacterized protein n=1 Tax=Tetragonisca angustula TaxID=166442 RepID=A0AAW1AHR3_9HYME